MTENKSGVDKNLQNVVKDLDATIVNSHQAQQYQQQTNDRRHQDALNHDKPIDNSLLTDKE
jgi:predicted secreted acid phosphatase